jgi:hypothetical protein
MSEYPIQVDEVINWLESRREQIEEARVICASIRSRQLHTPAVVADFDTEARIGRITMWMTGETEFEVLRTSDGTDAFLRHVSVANLRDGELQDAFSEFIQNMNGLQ